MHYDQDIVFISSQIESSVLYLMSVAANISKYYYGEYTDPLGAISHCDCLSVGQPQRSIAHSDIRLIVMAIKGQILMHWSNT